MKKFYVTTPIYYPSGNLHIGHAYSTVLADTFAKYKKQQGYKTYFLTGSDEHGQKIIESAKLAGLKPKAYLDIQVQKFIDLWKILDIDYNQFIRTTNPEHIKSCQMIFTKMLESNQIYKDKYLGKYCLPCESNWQLSQIEKIDGVYVCCDCNRPLKDVEEESYFLKLKGREKFIKDLFAKDFLFPQKNVSELLTKFVNPGLLDLSISRTTFNWGVPILQDPSHVMYVWIDALPNYISALGYGRKNTSLYDEFWNDETEILHVVGKEIIRFHAIYWPVILKNINALPKNLKILGHGWITAEGKKMSKSIGNVVDPKALVNKYGAEHLRYYLLKEIKTMSDGDFSQKRFINSYNSDLANKFGNLVSRVHTMIEKYFQGKIPYYLENATKFDKSLTSEFKTSYEGYIKSMDNYLTSNAIEHIISLIDQANNFIDKTKPWDLAKDKTNRDALGSILSLLVKAIEISSKMFIPILYKSAPKALKQFGIDPHTTIDINNFNTNFENLLSKKINLFPRLERE